jgi:CspA family cold shock protein
MTGAVLWFEPGKGYGYIHPDDGTADIFVHYGSMAGAGENSLADGDAAMQALKPGERVQFDIVEAMYGRQATHVRRAEA